MNTRICKICNTEKDLNEYRPNCLQCRKCMSKKQNERAKQKNYFKNYYLEHRDKLLEHQKELYKNNYKIKRLGDSAPVGRPKKCIL